jgi:ATP-dependent Lhr-like helicase
MQVYRRLEARGEIRGGRFVSGMSGEQFALPEAVSQLRAVRRQEADGRLVALGAGDPLNFTGIITPGERISGVGRNRILYRDGVPVLALESGEAKQLVPGEDTPSPELVQALVRKRLSPALRANLGMAGVPAGSVLPGKRSARRRTRKAAAKGE